MAGQGYLELRATAARHAEERFDTYSAQRDRLVGRVQRQRQWSETGVRKSKGSDPGQGGRARIGRSARRSRRRRCGASEKALERLDVVEKPWKRWELQLRFGGGERSGDVTVRLDRAVLRRGSFVLGPMDLELAWGERVALGGSERGGQDDAGRCADRAPGARPTGERWIGPGVRVGLLDQARHGFAGTLIDAFVEQSG